MASVRQSSSDFSSGPHAKRPKTKSLRKDNPSLNRSLTPSNGHGGSSQDVEIDEEAVEDVYKSISGALGISMKYFPSKVIHKALCRFVEEHQGLGVLHSIERHDELREELDVLTQDRKRLKEEGENLQKRLDAMSEVNGIFGHLVVLAIPASSRQQIEKSWSAIQRVAVELAIINGDVAYKLLYEPIDIESNDRADRPFRVNVTTAAWRTNDTERMNGLPYTSLLGSTAGCRSESCTCGTRSSVKTVHPQTHRPTPNVTCNSFQTWVQATDLDRVQLDPYSTLTVGILLERLALLHSMDLIRRDMTKRFAGSIARKAIESFSRDHIIVSYIPILLVLPEGNSTVPTLDMASMEESLEALKTQLQEDRFGGKLDKVRCVVGCIGSEGQNWHPYRIDLQENEFMLFDWGWRGFGGAEAIRSVFQPLVSRLVEDLDPTGPRLKDQGWEFACRWIRTPDSALPLAKSSGPLAIRIVQQLVADYSTALGSISSSVFISNTRPDLIATLRASQIWWLVINHQSCLDLFAALRGGRLFPDRKLLKES